MLSSRSDKVINITTSSSWNIHLSPSPKNSLPSGEGEDGRNSFFLICIFNGLENPMDLL